jgi:hypothetical protein
MRSHQFLKRGNQGFPLSPFARKIDSCFSQFNCGPLHSVHCSGQSMTRIILGLIIFDELLPDLDDLSELRNDSSIRLGNFGLLLRNQGEREEYGESNNDQFSLHGSVGCACNCNLRVQCQVYPLSHRPQIRRALKRTCDLQCCSPFRLHLPAVNTHKVNPVMPRQPGATASQVHFCARNKRTCAFSSSACARLTSTSETRARSFILLAHSTRRSFAATSP